MMYYPASHGLPDTGVARLTANETETSSSLWALGKDFTFWLISKVLVGYYFPLIMETIAGSTSEW